MKTFFQDNKQEMLRASIKQIMSLIGTEEFKGAVKPEIFSIFEKLLGQPDFSMLTLEEYITLKSDTSAYSSKLRNDCRELFLKHDKEFRRASLESVKRASLVA